MVGLVLGVAAGAGMFVALRRRAEAQRPATAAPTLDLGRPLPADVDAVVSSGWSRPRGDRLHRAIDVPVPIGTPVLAIDDGVVVHVQPRDEGDAGLWVAVQHPSRMTSRYLHLSRIRVGVGQRMRRGDLIGLSGDTGRSSTPHLHLDLRVPAEMLATVEALIGRPRTGWGPEMKPFGHSIPGEPLIPVDGYRDRVRREAAAAGVPLRERRNRALTYRPVGRRGERYPDWVQALKGQSGVYVIRIDGRVVYVGESHTGRLYETMTRHLQEWRRWKGWWRGQYGEGHDPGLTYDRSRVEVAARVVSPDDAIDEEARLIRRLQPRDNLVGQADDDVPF